MLPYFVGPTALEKKHSPITKKRNSRLQSDRISGNQNSPRQKQRKLILNLFQKRQGYYIIWKNPATFLLSVLLQHKFTFLFVFQIFFPTDNTLFYNQYNAILQTGTTEHKGIWTLVLIQ